MSETKQLTVEQAMSLLPEGKKIHVYCNPGGMLIGSDWNREDVVNEFNNNPESIEVGGNQCRAINHAIVVMKSDGPWFFSNDKNKLDEFDPQ